MRNLIVSALSVLSICSMIVPVRVAAANQPIIVDAGAHDNYLDIRKNFNGARVPGHAGIHIVGNNPFRQTRVVSVTPQLIAAPDLSFLVGSASSSPSVAAAAGKSGGGPGCDFFEDAFAGKDGFATCLSQLAKDFGVLQADINATIADDRSLMTDEDIILYQDFPDGITDARSFKDYKRTLQACMLGNTAISPAKSCRNGVSVVTADKDIQQLQNLYAAIQDHYRVVNAHAPPDKVPPALQAIQTGITSDGPLIATLTTYRDSVLAPMVGGSTDPFIYESQQTCSLLYNSGRNNQIVVSVSTAAVPGQAPTTPASGTGGAQSANASGTQTYDVTAVCPPPVFVSIGLGTDAIPNYSYSTAQPNLAGQPTPAPGATAVPGTILQNNAGARAVAFTMANYSPWENANGSGVTLSLGLGVPLSNPNGVKPDILGGVSYSVRRTIVFTIGMAYGSTTTLAPGYSVNGPILATATPPTTTNYKAGFFFGLSFSK